MIFENDNKLQRKNVETYTDDIVRALESDKGGLIKKIIHEEEVHEVLKKNLSPESRRNKLFMSASFLLLFLAVTLLSFLLLYNTPGDPVSVVPSFTSLIFTDKTEFKTVDGLTKDQLIDVVSTAVRNTRVKIGEVEGIYLVENKKVVGFRRFTELVKSSLTSSPLVAAVSENFLLGAVKSFASSPDTAGGDFFMLLEIRSFPDAFSLMRYWEKRIFRDLHGFLDMKISSATDYLLAKSFEDGIVQNQYTRALKDRSGKTVLGYAFVSNSSVIITGSEAAIEEILPRLFLSRVNK